MIPLSKAAEAALEALADHYAALGRDRANDPDDFLAAPRPYPGLADLGFLWTKQGPYWIAFAKTTNGPVVAGVFHDTANIPRRV